MKASIICGGLFALGLVTTPALAQSEGKELTDTLRRSLRVLTDEEAESSPRMPLQIRLEAPAPQRVRLTQTGPSLLPRVDGLPSVPPLTALPPLPSLYEKVNQRGYITGALGLSYNARLAGGYRALNSDRELLDLNLDLFGTNYKRGIEWVDMTIKEFGFGAGGSYQRKLANSALSIDAQYRYGRNNAYGTPYVQDEFPLTTASDLRQFSSMTDEQLPYHTLKAKVDYSGRAEWNGLWEYKIAPEFTLSKRSGFTETGLGLVAVFSKNLGTDQTLGIDGRLVSLGYSGNDRLTTRLPLWYVSGMTLLPLDTRSDSKMAVELLPSWAIEGVGSSLSWSARAGVGVHFYSDQGHSGTFLTPQIEGLLRFAGSWFARLSLTGGVREGSLYDLVSATPQLHLSSLPTLAKERLSAELRLGGAIRPNLSLEAFAGYARLDALSNAEARIETASSSDGTVHALSYTFAPVDAQRFRIGAMLDYEAQDWFRLGAKATYSHWSTSEANRPITARPSLELGLSIGLKPLEQLDLKFAYQLYSGAEAYLQESDYSTGAIVSRSREVSIPVYHTLSAQGVYLLSQRFSLSADAFFSPSKGGTLYWGYAVQKFGVNAGFSYLF